MPICCHLVCAALHYSFQLDYDRYEVRLPVAWPYRLSTRLCWRTFLPVGRHTCPPNVYAHVHCRDRQRLSNIGLTCLIWKTILVSHCYRQCTAFSFCHTSRGYHCSPLYKGRGWTCSVCYTGAYIPYFIFFCSFPVPADTVTCGYDYRQV